MKKKIFGGIAVLAIAAVAALNLNFNTQSNDLSAINLANVEALASEAKDETGGIKKAPYDLETGHCYKLNTLSCPGM